MSTAAGRARRRLAPEQRRGEIVVAADRLFRRTDPFEVTGEEIAAAAGVSRGLVHNYFPDRAELVAAVLRANLERLDRSVEEALAGVAGPQRRFEVLVRAYLEFAHRHAGSFRYLVGAVGGAAGGHRAVRAVRRERMERLARVWGGAPDARPGGTAPGGTVPGADVVASTVVGLLEGAALACVERRGDPEETAVLVSRLLWPGLEHLGAVPD